MRTGGKSRALRDSGQSRSQDSKIEKKEKVVAERFGVIVVLSQILIFWFLFLKFLCCFVFLVLFIYSLTYLCSRAKKVLHKKSLHIFLHAYFFFGCFMPHISWQSLQLLIPKWAIPARIKSKLHHWTFQKFHNPRSLDKNNNPAIRRIIPPCLEQLWHFIIHICITSDCRVYRCECIILTNIKNGKTYSFLKGKLFCRLKKEWIS